MAKLADRHPFFVPLQVFSFKLRGAYNKMASLTPEQREIGVITSSAGNHAQGVALSAQALVRLFDILQHFSLETRVWEGNHHCKILMSIDCCLYIFSRNSRSFDA